MAQTNPSAIMTGDLVASRRATPAQVDAAMLALTSGAETLGRIWGITPHFTRFRGDGWQIYLSDPGLILDAAVHLFGSLRAADIGITTRAAVAVGQVETLGTTGLSDATGPAFVRSGDLLETMDKHSRLQIGGDVQQWHRAIFDLVDFQISRWTPAQAQAVILSLTTGFDRQSDIADHLQISRQAVQLRLAGAGAAYLDQALQVVRTHNYNLKSDI